VSRRDRALAAIIGPHGAGKSVLELGCGEGHLSASVFSGAHCIKGIDISSIAVSRATALTGVVSALGSFPDVGAREPESALSPITDINDCRIDVRFVPKD
jgi:SAM-dependent methyltransferase